MLFSAVLGRDLHSLGHWQFSHTSKLGVLDRMDSLAEKLHTEGYAEICETDTASSTYQVARQVCNAIGAEVMETEDILIATSKGSKPPNTYGGHYGYDQLPLHTDLAHWHRPPRYILLRCIYGSPEVSTQLFNRRQLESWISPSLMSRALFAPRRRLDGRLFLLRMVDNEMLRWDRLFLKPHNTAAQEVVRKMEKIASKLPVVNVALATTGQTLIVDNWAVLHGRSAIPSTSTDRKLERIYLEISSNGRKITS